MIFNRETTGMDAGDTTIVLYNGNVVNLKSDFYNYKESYLDIYLDIVTYKDIDIYDLKSLIKKKLLKDSMYDINMDKVYDICTINNTVYKAIRFNIKRI